MLCLLVFYSGSLSDLSRDSVQYHEWGQEKALEYAEGRIQWSNWIDEGWKEFVGEVYFVVGPYLFVVVLVNALFSAAAAVVAYRVSLLAFENEPAAAAIGYLVALFPSVVYYTSLPMKEAAAMFGILCIVLGILMFISETGRHAWPWMAAGLAVMTALRLYLVPVLVGCAALCILMKRMKPGGAALVQIGFCALFLGGAGYVLVRQYGVNLNEYQAFEYYNVDRVNYVRGNLTRGNARMYEHRSDAAFGDDLLDNITKIVKGVTYFFLSIDPTNISRARQAAAIPEMLFFLYSIPYLFAAVVTGWKTRASRILPIILVAVVIIAVYGSAATNAGAMYRWRVQALPFLLMLTVYGATVRRKGLIYGLVRRFERPSLSRRRPRRLEATGRV